jgi:hypothetical protein
VEINEKWEMLNESLVVCLEKKKDIIFFRQLLFNEHEIGQALKNRLGKRSKTLDEREQLELMGAMGGIRKKSSEQKDDTNDKSHLGNRTKSLVNI